MTGIEGNSQSQSEVKIVSCIPIDVADLQKRIESLKTALREAKEKHDKSVQVCAPICCGECEVKVPVVSCSRECKVKVPDVSCSRELETIDYIQTPELQPNMESYEFCNRKTRPGILSKKNPKKKKSTCEEDYTRELKRDVSAKKSTKKRFWYPNNHRRAYYAQTMTVNPLSFCNENQATGNVSRKEYVDIDVNCPYLVNVLRKQYQSGIVFDDNVPSGAISVPICCDPSGPSAADSRPAADTPDMPDTPDTCATATDTSAPRCYYDEQFYDVIPVKEMSEKKHRTPKEHGLCEDCYTSSFIKFSLPDYSRPKVRVTNYSVAETRTHHHRRHRKRDKIMKQMSGTREKRRRCYYDPCVANSVTKHSYHNSSTTLPDGTKMENNYRSPKHTTKQHSHKNRRSRRHTQCQTESAQQNEKHNDQLLIQIKSILQTVLTEVKLSTMGRNSSANNRKDAFVQKGPSANDMRVNSSFIRSYNYTPYESYILPAQRPRPPAPFPQSNICGVCYPMVYQPPLVYPSNAQCPPIILQQSNQPPMKAQPSMNVASTSTNTDSASTKLEESNKIGPETKQLIKDIYKTLTANMPDIDSGKTFPTSTSDHIYKRFNVNQSESETIKMADARNAEIESRSIENSQYRQVTSRSASDSTSESRNAINEMHTSSSDTSSTLSKKSVISIPAPSESTLTPITSKSKKKGRISKILNSVFKKKVNNKRNASDDQFSRDSDDYQTIYSQKATRSASRPPTSNNQLENDTRYHTIQRSALIQYPVYQRPRVTELHSGVQSYADEEAEAVQRRVRFLQECESTDADIKKKCKALFPWFKCRMGSWRDFIVES